jgi:hypothetical protein
MALFAFLFLVVSLVTFMIFLLHEDTEKGIKNYFKASLIREGLLLVLAIYAFWIFDHIKYDIK